MDGQKGDGRRLPSPPPRISKASMPAWRRCMEAAMEEEDLGEILFSLHIGFIALYTIIKANNQIKVC